MRRLRKLLWVVVKNVLISSLVASTIATLKPIIQKRRQEQSRPVAFEDWPDVPRNSDH